MEEKEVKMGVVNGQGSQDTPKDQKYTYEQLNDLCGKLYQENQYLKQQLRQADSFIQSINKLDYLFKVVEIQDANKSAKTFTEEFYYKCVGEIERALAIDEKEQQDSEEN